MEHIYPYLAVLFAATLSTSIGFGFALLAVPFLIMAFPAKLAIAVNMALSLLTYLINMPRVWAHIDSKFTVKLILGASLGIPIGTLCYIYLDIKWLKIIISSVILILTALLIKGYTLPLPRRGAPQVVGVMSGVLGSAVSLPGPPVILYLASKDIDKKQSVGITTSLFTFVYFISLILYAVIGKLTKQIWPIALPLIPCVLVGIVLGSIIHKHINQKMFRNMTYAVLVISASYIIVTTL